MRTSLLALFICLVNHCFAEDIITYFPSSRPIKSEIQNCEARLAKVCIRENITTVTIQLTATRNTDALRFWTSEQTYISAGDAKLPLIGALKDKGNRLQGVHSCTYNDGLYFPNIKKGQQCYYTLGFSGRIPPGITNFSLIDPATSGRGFSFRNYTINNPPNNKIIYDEHYCRDFADKVNDGICGIYEQVGEGNLRLGCIKYLGEYILVYLEKPNSLLTWWFTGDTKAILEESATPGIFKAKTWINEDKIGTTNAYVNFEGATMKTIVDKKESTYLKMYPTATQGSSIGEDITNAAAWTGTGFALKNNYIVTNYHVIENAKKIHIHGINGNFNKKYSASIVATDKFNDLALLRVDGCTISSVNIPYSVKTFSSDVGEDVFVLGYPLTSTMGEEIKLTTGVISSRTGFQGDVSLYQVSAPIQSGNSGGPLFDSKGNIIGIVSSKHKNAENVGYAIKTTYLRNLMESVMSSNILPQNNKISTLSLSEKVKRVKNYVYYITCSNM